MSKRQYSQRRKVQKATGALQGSLEDPVMRKFLDDPPCPVNLHTARTVSEVAMVEKVKLFWEHLLFNGVLLPKHEHATWFNMPDEAKIWAFLALRERAILWSVEQFNDKGSAKLSKLRANMENKNYRKNMQVPTK